MLMIDLSLKLTDLLCMQPEGEEAEVSSAPTVEAPGPSYILKVQQVCTRKYMFCKCALQLWDC